MHLWGHCKEELLSEVGSGVKVSICCLSVSLGQLRVVETVRGFLADRSKLSLVGEYLNVFREQQMRSSARKCSSSSSSSVF